MPLLRTLGSTAVSAPDGRGELHLDVQPRRLALLVYLARGRQGHPVRRDELLALFWPEADDLHGRGLLRQALTAFRKQLGADTIETRSEEEVGIAAGGLPCDATQFDGACRACRWEEACALYRGAFLAGFHASGVSPEFEQWVDSERNALRRAAANAAWAMSKLRGEAGAGTDAIHWARRAVELEPESEVGTRQLITLLEAYGDRAGAMEVYATLARRLAADFESPPAPETRALINQIKTRPTPAEAPGTPLAVASPMLPPGALAPQAAEGPARAPAAITPPIARAGSRRGLLLAGAMGGLLTLIIATTLALSGRQHPPAPATTGVMPFRNLVTDSSLAWVGDGMVDLLTVRLAGDPALQVVEPRMVMAAWGPGTGTAPRSRERVADDVARNLGLGQVIEGSILGNERRVTLTAWVRSVPGNRITARALTEGSPDVLPLLIDNLAGQLLGVTAGVEAHRIPSLASASLPAIRAFLAGRTANRHGRPEEAIQQFSEAIALDSTFALAGLDLARTATWTTGAGPASREGLRVARRHRMRLSIADQALLDVTLGEWLNAEDMFTRLSALTVAYPDRPEAWYRLGGGYFHWGRLAGVEGWLQRADDAFHRGWMLDSTMAAAAHPGEPLVAEPAKRMVELAHLRGDTAELHRLAARILAADSNSILAHTVRWHLAVLEGPAARARYWEHFEAAAQGTSLDIIVFIKATGLGMEDRARAEAEDMRRLQVSRPGLADRVQWMHALNSGRPSRVPASTEAAGFAPRQGLRNRILDAMSWDGDTLAALDAVRVLARLQHVPPASSDQRLAHTLDACTLGLWHASRGAAPAAAAARRALVSAPTPPGMSRQDSMNLAHYVELCVALIDAHPASAMQGPTVLERVAVADSLARTYPFEVCCGSDAITNANLILARMWEEQGDQNRALLAIRRRSAGYMLAPMYLSSFLREEGRLSLMTGDTAAAIRAYGRYLVLRSDPEPPQRPEVDAVRATLARLRP